VSSIVALRALGLGDLLTAVPALRALRRAAAGAPIVLACPPSLHGLVRLWHLADRAIPARPLEPLAAAPRRPDLAVNLHGRGPESSRSLVALRPGTLLAFTHARVPETLGMPRWRPGEHEVGRWCRLLREGGIEADAAELRADRPPLPRRLAHLAGATVLHPGAASEARRWPLPRWTALARRERAAGRPVVLTGSAGERERCLDVALAAGASGIEVVAGATSLVELAGLVGAADVVVCGDTGIAHLATALGVRSVVLFGPVPPSEWGPPSDDRHVALWAGRRGDPHGSRVDPGLLALSVEDVLAGLDRVRAPSRRAHRVSATP
jgi:ADP-heptose:LPS heptosyltransferase